MLEGVDVSQGGCGARWGWDARAGSSVRSGDSWDVLRGGIRAGDSCCGWEGGFLGPFDRGVNVMKPYCNFLRME